MSRSSFHGALAPTLVFTLCTVVALPLGWYAGDGASWKKDYALLQKAEEEMIAGASFHRPARRPQYPGAAGYCEGCHSLPPHDGAGIEQAFLNQHASRFDCLVCHWARVSGNRPALSWLRLPVKDSARGQMKDQLTVRMEGSLGMDGTKIAALRDKVIVSQKCFDRGAGCKNCHRGGGIGEYARSDMSKREIANLEKLADFFVLAKGKKWYFPQRQKAIESP